MQKEIVFDVDGTLRSYGHRDHLVPEVKTVESNWRDHAMACKLEMPSTEMIDLVKAYKSEGYRIIMLTVASECARVENLKYFAKYDIPCDQLIMRQAEDNRPPAEMKHCVLTMLLELGVNIRAFYDDCIDNCHAALKAGVPIVGHVELERQTAVLRNIDHMSNQSLKDIA